jgi:hypothetical protein
MPAPERKRPWYLVLALLGSLALGTGGTCSSWRTISLYREPVDPSRDGQGIANEASRQAVVARAQAYLNALDAAKSRAWPLAVATLLLGGAMVVFAMRAMAGSAGARAALVQLVIVQAGANAAAYWLIHDVLETDLRLAEARQATQLHENIPERSRADELARVVLTLGTLGSALVVVALTRRRSREFFEPAGAAVEGR